MILGKEMGPGSCQLAEEIDFLGRRHRAFLRIASGRGKAGLKDYENTDYGLLTTRQRDYGLQDH
jgi:hypothetical protein